MEEIRIFTYNLFMPITK